MTTFETTMLDCAHDASVRAARAEAVASFIARAKASAAARPDGVPDRVVTSTTLIELGRQGALFPFAHFPVEADRVTPFYRLSEDGDGGFALYAAVGLPGKRQPPHNHTTWGAIAGVRGIERNVVYRRLPSADPSRAQPEEKNAVDVVPGVAITLAPDDIHTTELLGDEPSLHLHFYGLSQERMFDRVRFEGSHGGAITPVPVSTAIRHPSMDVRMLRTRLSLTEELAVFDVREEGRFATGHLPEAANLPVSRIEVQVLARVPRLATPIVVLDEAEEIAQEAAAKLLRIGYTNVSVLRGGTRAWAEAGEPVVQGVWVPGKLAAEQALARLSLRELSVPECLELQRIQQTLLLDVRPFDEFTAYTIPGSTNCPVGELPARVPAFVVHNAAMPIIVHCAGRARSIRAAQILHDMDLANPVYILRNGTMAWELHGLPLETGRRDALPEAGALPRPNAPDRVPLLDTDRLREWESMNDRCTLYRFDVRTPEAFVAGHLPGWQSVSGGQLLHAIERYAPTRHARIVLADWDGVRAPTIALLLVDLGYYDVALFQPGWHNTLEAGESPVRTVAVSEVRTPWIDCSALARHLREGTAIIFYVDSSASFRRQHLQGARFATADVALATLQAEACSRVVVITSSDGVLARAIASELRRKTALDVRALLGGNIAAFAAGLPVASGDSGLLNADDTWHGPHSLRGEVERRNAFLDYIEWETALARDFRIRPDGRVQRAPASLDT